MSGELLPALASARRADRLLDRDSIVPADVARRVLPGRRASGPDAARDRRLPAVSAALLAQPQPRAAARGRARRDRGTARHRPGAVGLSRAWCRSPSPATFVLLEDIIAAHLPQLFPGPADPGVGRRSGSRATPSWSSTTKAAGRSSSWSSASCGAGDGATSFGSRSERTRRRNSSTCSAISST